MRVVQWLRMLLWMGCMGCFLLRVGEVDAQVYVQEPASVHELFRRADDAIQRAQWKLAVDSLQRVIDDPQNSLVGEEGAVLESARSQAYRRLSILPPEGAELYDLLHGARARSMYELALANHDSTLMQEVTAHYLLTPSGRHASLALARWHLDDGSPLVALRLLRTLERFGSGESESFDVRVMMLAMAHAQLGQVETARSLLGRIESGGGEAQCAMHIRQHLEGLAGPGDVMENYEGTVIEPGRWSTGDRPDGAKPAVMPSLSQGALWRYTFTSVQTPHWSDVLSQQLQQGVYFQRQLITDGERVYTKLANTVVALDVLGLDPVWESRAPVEARVSDEIEERMQFVNVWHPDQPDPLPESDEWMQGLLWDQHSAQLGLAQGMIFELSWIHPFDVVHRASRSSTPGAGPIWIQGSRTDLESLSANRLIAHAADDRGRIRWILGGERDSSDRWHGVSFASTPVEADGDLLTVYWRKSDLYAGMLDPDTGELLDAVYLCSMGDRDYRPEHCLQPVVAGGVAFIPTNAGMLFALDLFDKSLLWASQYDSMDVSTQAEDSPTGSSRGHPEGPLKPRPSPLISTGTLILVAGADASIITAVDQITGRVMWQQPRNAQDYLIAASGERVWIGGDDIICMSLQDGSILWQHPVSRTTGEAVLSGQNILVPTHTGLLILDAAQGLVTAEQSLPAGELPLGALQSVGDALYSLDSQSVRKYPDLDRSYRTAVKDHQSDSQDVVAALQLAWLEYIQDRPQAALEVLDALQLKDIDIKKRREIQVGRLKVRALLRLAESLDPESPEALFWLERAWAESQDPRDRVSTLLVWGALDSSAGRHRQAYERLWRYVIDQKPSYIFPAGIQHDVDVRVKLAEQLRNWRSALSHEEQTELAESLSEQSPFHKDSETLAEDVSTEALVALCINDSPNGWDQSACAALAQRHYKNAQYEVADTYWREVIDLNARQPEARFAMESLWSMYLSPIGELPQLAQSLLAAYEQVFLEEPGNDTVQASQSRLQAGIDSLSRQMESRLETGVTPQNFVQIPGHLVHCLSGGLSDSRLEHVDSQFAAQREFSRLGDRVITFEAPDQLFAHRVSDGALLWKTRLILLSEAGLEVSQNGRATPFNPGPPWRSTARVVGQSLIINNRTGLHAVGLTTGRRLWSTELYISHTFAQWPDASLFDVDDERVVLRKSNRQIECRRLADGSLIWSTYIRAFPVTSLRISGSSVVVTSQEGHAFSVLNLADGQRRYHKGSSHASNAEGPGVAVTGNTVCVIDGESLVGYAIQDGSTLWSVDLRGGPSILLTVSSDCVLVGAAEGYCLAVNPVNGNVQCDLVLPADKQRIVDAVVCDERLYIIGEVVQHRQKVLQLTAVSLQIGEPIWNKSDLDAILMKFSRPAARVPCHPNLCADSQNIYLVSELSPDSDSGEGVLAYTLQLFDRQSGALARTLTVPMPGGSILPTGDLDILSRRVMLGTTNGVLVYDTASLLE